MTENPQQTRTDAANAAGYAVSLSALLEVTRTVRSGADIDSVLDAIARAAHAALALEAAQERERLHRHQRGLEELLRVSSQLPQTMSTDAMLTFVCEAVRDALGFEKVMIHLVDADTDSLLPTASAG